MYFYIKSIAKDTHFSTPTSEDLQNNTKEQPYLQAIIKKYFNKCHYSIKFKTTSITRSLGSTDLCRQQKNYECENVPLYNFISQKPTQKISEECNS